MLSTEHAAMMNELIEDHVYSRKTTSSLAEANAKYANGNAESWRDVWKSLNDLVELYPRHIEKEDSKFFYPVMDYFAPHEREAMLGEFWEFDRKLIHEKYEHVVSELEKITALE
jgi:hemerythrin-like domain-containing protein